MDDIEEKLENLNKLFDEAHKIDEDNIVKINPKNKIGKIANSWISKLNVQEEIKKDAPSYVEQMDKIQEENKSVTDQSEDNKVIDFPTELLPIIKEDYPLTIQKETSKSLVLSKKVGSVVTSILITAVTFAVGVVLAIFIRG